MKVLEVFKDGSRSLLFEPGDRVQLTKDQTAFISFSDAKKGDKATVIRRKAPLKYESLAFLEIQTDEMKAAGLGVISVPPWDLAPLEE